MFFFNKNVSSVKENQKFIERNVTLMVNKNQIEIVAKIIVLMTK